MSERADESTANHLVSYPRFIWRSLVQATEGSLLFYGWMTLLTAVALVGANAYAHQLAGGMVTTNMTDHVSWGCILRISRSWSGWRPGR